MARFIQNVELNKPDDFVYFMMNDYLQKNGFIMSDWKGEPAYRAGDAMVEGYKYLKWSYSNGTFHLEAWLKGTFGGEMGLDGFVGCLMKKPYRENLMQLITLLQQTLPDSVNTAASAPDMTSDAGATQNPNPNVIPVQTMDNYKAAQQALILGIVSILLCWSLLFCIVCTALTFARARMGKNSSKAGLATAGKVCSIVAVIIAIVLYLLNLALNVLYIL